MPRSESGPPHDDDLRSRFDALRRADQAAAPEFGVALAPVGARTRRPVTLPAALAAAAIILALVGLRFATQRTRLEPPRAPSILSWRSPTAALLQTPGLELLRTVPTLRSSLLRGVPWESLATRHPGA